MPSVEVDAHTTSIRTVEDLFESQSSGWSVEAGLKIKLFSASYERSEQTTNMINNIYKNKQEYYHTYVKVSHFKLSMFQPKLELSDSFRYVIENMPTGTYNDVIDKYIQTWILEYFGYTYTTDILLGKFFFSQEIFYLYYIYSFSKRRYCSTYYVHRREFC